MKIVITGANGFLGSWLTRKFVDLKYETFALVRKTSDLSELAGVNCQYLYGDVNDIESLDQAFVNADAVFHLAGLIAYRRRDRPMMEKVNVDGTRNVITSVKKCNVKRLVHASSIAAVGSGFTPDQILNEESTFNLHHLNLGYFETKRKAEDLVMSAVRNESLNAVILNPSTIYGAGDARKGSRKTQVKVAQGKFPFYPPGGVNIVAVEDVVEGFYRAWQQGQTGERYIMASENLLLKQVFDTIAQIAGQKAPSIPLPSWFIHPMGYVGDFLNALNVETSLSSETAWTSTLYHWYDSSKAQKALGLQFQPAQSCLEKSVRWMMEHHYV